MLVVFVLAIFIKVNAACYKKEDLTPTIYLNGKDCTNRTCFAPVGTVVELSCKVEQDTKVTHSGVLFRWYNNSMKKNELFEDKTDEVVNVLYSNMTRNVTENIRHTCKTDGSACYISGSSWIRITTHHPVDVPTTSPPDQKPAILVNGSDVTNGVMEAKYGELINLECKIRRSQNKATATTYLRMEFTNSGTERLGLTNDASTISNRYNVVIRHNTIIKCWNEAQGHHSTAEIRVSNVVSEDDV